MKVIFLGSSRYVIPVLETIYNNFELTLVVTTEQSKIQAIPFFCTTKKIDCLSVLKPADLTVSYRIEKAAADLGVVADFGLIIPKKTLDIFPLGLINIHPSLLPKYRGPTPVQNAILNGDDETGVSIIKLDKYVDHGPIISQVTEKIMPDDTAKSLYERLFEKGASLLLETLTDYAASKISETPQDHSGATFTKPLTRDDGFIDFDNISFGRDFFERMVRAYYPWPGVWTKVSLSGKKEELRVVKFLPNNKIQAEGGREMSYVDFINGYPNVDSKLIKFLKEDIK